MDATTGAHRDAYYTEPCECGATSALHLGHTQACADRHASAAVEYPATVTATPVGKGRAWNIDGTAGQLSAFDEVTRG